MTDLNQLVPGDVLVFEGDKDPAHKGQWVDQLIMDLTHSTVTHGAIFYAPGVLVDANIGAIANHAIRPGVTNTVHVRRLAGNLDLSPVLAATQRYVAEHDNYDWAGLVMAGLILIYRDLSAPSPTQRLATWLFERLAVRLTDWLNAKLAESGKYEPGPHPMFCSEFVYQCFADAQGEYVLQIRHGDILLATGGGNLLDRLSSMATAGLPERALAGAPEPALTALSDMDLAQALCGELQGGRLAADALEPAFAAAVANFERAWMRAITKNPDAEPEAPFAFLQARKAMFVTPSDLLSHCQNLVDQGTVTLDRDSQPLPPA